MVVGLENLLFVTRLIICFFGIIVLKIAMVHILRCRCEISTNLQRVAYLMSSVNTAEHVLAPILFEL